MPLRGSSLTNVSDTFELYQLEPEGEVDFPPQSRSKIVPNVPDMRRSWSARICDILVMPPRMLPPSSREQIRQLVLSSFATVLGASAESQRYGFPRGVI